MVIQRKYATIINAYGIEQSRSQSSRPHRGSQASEKAAPSTSSRVIHESRLLARITSSGITAASVLDDKKTRRQWGVPRHFTQVG